MPSTQQFAVVLHSRRLVLAAAHSLPQDQATRRSQDIEGTDNLQQEKHVKVCQSMSKYVKICQNSLRGQELTFLRL
jgi:hypothetical protein